MSLKRVVRIKKYNGPTTFPQSPKLWVDDPPPPADPKMIAAMYDIVLGKDRTKLRRRIQ